MRNQSERFTQNMLMMSMACLRGGVNQPNSVHETVFQPGSISPRAQPTTSSPSYSTPTSAPPSCSTPYSAPPPPPAGPEVQQYSNYVVTDELLKDMHKRLRKSGEGISKIPKHTDMDIPCRPVAILTEEDSKPLPSPSSQLPPPAPPMPPSAPLLPQEPQVETTSD